MDDIFDKCNVEAIPDAEERALAFELFRAVSPPDNAGPLLEMDGRTLIQFSSNDYLGLASHPEVRARVAEVIGEHGTCAPMGSRLMTGTTEYHLEFERQLARFKRCEAAVTFSTGAGAMIGTLAAIADNRDLLILDERAHASLRCGAKISGAALRFFHHNDTDHLEQILRGTREFDRRAVVVDGVYSMDGDVARFAELVALKKQFGFRLIVDDAHGTGVFGEDGRGSAAHFGAEHEVDLHLGTCSKAMGSIGGFAAGPVEVIRFIYAHAPTFVFTKSTPLVMVIASSTALELLEEAETERAVLWANARRLQQGLAAAGFDIGSTQSPITPVRFPGNTALQVAKQLRDEHDLWTSPVLYPAVEAGSSLLRLIPTARHTEEHIEQLLEAVVQVRESVEV